jgi:hypothetical protein
MSEQLRNAAAAAGVGWLVGCTCDLAPCSPGSCFRGPGAGRGSRNRKAALVEECLALLFRRYYSLRRDDSDLVVFCFAKPEDAEALTPVVFVNPFITATNASCSLRTKDLNLSKEAAHHFQASKVLFAPMLWPIPPKPAR